MSKIAIFSIYSGVVERGVETFTYEMAKRLSKKHEIVVFQAGSLPPQSYKIKQIKTSILHPKSSKGFLGKTYLDFQSFKIFIFTAKAIPFLLRGKYNVIIGTNGGWQTPILRIVSKITASKFIIPGAAGIGSDDAWNLLFRPDVFIALTNAQAKWAKRLTPEIQVETIPNGVDLSKFNPKVKPKDLALKKPLVICTSALVPYKRVDLTIKAVAQTKDLSLLVLGDGELKGSVDALGKRLLGKRYLRLVVPYSQIPLYYRAGNVFTLVSKTEAFGISYIEAMACNLPVVATSDESRQEIIGRAGILTEPTDIKKYAKDLQLAAKINYRNIPYDQAQKFSWNKIAESYLTLIEKLLKK